MSIHDETTMKKIVQGSKIESEVSMLFHMHDQGRPY